MLQKRSEDIRAAALHRDGDQGWSPLVSPVGRGARVEERLDGGQRAPSNGLGQRRGTARLDEVFPPESQKRVENGGMALGKAMIGTDNLAQRAPAACPRFTGVVESGPRSNKQLSALHALW